MKAHLFLAVVLVILRIGSLEGAAQGTFSFNNSSTTRLTNILGTAVPVNSLTVAMFFSTNLSALTNSSLPMVLNTNAVTTISPVAGRFTGGTVAVPGVPQGGFVVATIRAWNGQYPSSEIAFEQPFCYVGDSEQTTGRSIRFLLGPLGFPPGGTNPIPTLVGAGFQGFLVGQFFSGIPGIGCFGPPPYLKLSVVPSSQPYRVRVSGPALNGTIRFRLQSSPTLASNSWQMRTFIYASSVPWTNEWTDPQGTNGPLFYRVTSEY